MKKLLSIYLLSITVVVIVMYLISTKNDTHEHNDNRIPQKISVYFADEDCIRELDFEDYVVGVISAEVPAEFEIEAIKAQAVAARTYILNKQNKFSEDEVIIPPEHKGAYLCTNSKHCCAYYSKERLAEIHGDKWMKKYYKKLEKCVRDTKNEILTYDNEPILAVFHASSGGCRTENSGDVWSTNLPYLKSVESPSEDKRDGYNSAVTIHCDEFKAIINTHIPNAALDNDRNKWIGDIAYTDGNSVKEIKIGNEYIKGTQMRSLFGLKSACFEISILNDIVTFNVHGSGHGVGMSQHGANIMAGNNKDYKEILAHYYSGAILTK